MVAEPEEHDAAVQGRVTGIIYPPPDIRAVVDKTAQFVANNGRAFESRIVGERVSAKFSFLRESDPYHAYYEHKVSEFTVKKEDPLPAPEPQQPEHTAEGQQETTQEIAKAVETVGDVVVEKKAVQDVTAQVAKNIRGRELEPPPEEIFIIKHPTLSALDQEIMYLTAQYTALSGSSFLSGLATREQRNPQFDFLKPTHPLFAYFTALVESYTLVLAKQDAQMKRIEDGMERMKVLDRCVHRMEWQRTEQEREDKEAAEGDAERRALAQVDWHDFVIVETINFDDDDDLGASATVGEGEAKGSDDDMDMEEDDDDEPKPEIKVVEDYVPQATAGTTQQPLLSVDGKTLSSAEANEHMRILLMNPKWREETQRHLEKQKESSYAAGSAIADSLRRFATKRADIFASSAEEEARLLQATTAPTITEQRQQQQEDDMEDNSDEETKTVLSSDLSQAQQVPAPTEFAEQGQTPTGAPGSQPVPAMLMPPGVVPLGMGVRMPAPGMMPRSAGPSGLVPPHLQAPGAVPPGMSAGPPGIAAGPPGVSGPPGEDLEPAAKRQRTGGSSLMPEKEFASRHPGMVRLIVKVPNDPDNAQWKLTGQTLTVELDVKDNMRTLKQKLMVSVLLVGFPCFVR
ncbi:splicing factor 3 subunit, putative [Phytophthora infestans T30-4]|uniref:Splicing factor 3 subunit, putative n=1 Tax=Phytophthora infestans (strain T30-4) TaxID=403677 RepID=D0N1H1_PHYIT|nr:splicing factor 3 subunit, putative [Phytophthora infestans T30-4]EEY68150.1 splicing factor 3 subunit, putative [Phytophthora infestans T30-4]|eukprot:XP_002905309.1 splicing factor 3 subunit, putative [Phytophthora infestans T30-4]